MLPDTKVVIALKVGEMSAQTYSAKTLVPVSKLMEVEIFDHPVSTDAVKWTCRFQ